jgi:thiosulfate/3-mercaptopyruvate sulfurtransferase
MPWLINAAQLEKFRKAQKNIVIIDASWHLDADNRNAKQEFMEAHISSARFLNLSDFHDTETSLPNMLIRSEELVNKKIGALGITNDHKIIFYDKSALHTSCRALWMFKFFGHNPNQLYILDGGLAAWEKFGGKVETGDAKNVPAKSYTVNFEAQCLRSLVQMKTNLRHPSEQVIDLRHAIRFAGGKEHREGVRSGHIPSSFSFPYSTMFDADGFFKPLERIRKQLSGISVELSQPIITTCGSGMSAAILNFVLDLMSHTQHSLYDGSWTEWGAEALYAGEENLAERPVETCLD